MLKAVIFDVEGTLLNSLEHRALAWREAIREFGPDPDPAAIVPYAAGAESEVPRRFLDPAILAEVTSERVISRYRDLWESVHAHGVTAIPGGVELVRDLAERGLRVVLATRAHASRIGDLMRTLGFERVEIVATGAETDGPVVRVVGEPIEATGISGSPQEPSADDGERDIFARAIARAEADPAEALAVVHGAADAKAASVMGLRVIGLLSGGASAADLMAAGCDRVYSSAAEMRERLSDLADLGKSTA